MSLIKPIFRTPESGHYFFGYYDKSSLSIDNTKLLAQRSAFIDRAPENGDVLELGYFDWRESERFNKISETRAWNWQQGCMLQWLGPDFTNRIIYNDCLDGRFVSVTIDLTSRAKTILDMPVYSVNSNGEFALCLDFERLYWFRRGYSYPGVENHNKNVPIDYTTGVSLLDIANNTARQIVSLKDLMSNAPISCMERAVHYIEHAMFSPNGKRFCFLHRWQMDDGGIYTRLYTADTDGNNICLLHDSGRVSHCCWRNDCQILAYCGLETPVNRVRKHKLSAKILKLLLPCYHKIIGRTSMIARYVTGNSYVLFNDNAGVHSRVGACTLLEDGHPSFCPANQDVFVTDTYPGKNSMVPLILYDLKSDQMKVLDELRSIPEYDDSGERCDLHPRWSFDGKYLTVDTMDRGVRGIYLYETQ